MEIGVSPWYPDQPVSRVDPATAAVIARMTNPPNAARTTLIDTTIKALRASGVWDKLDALWVMAAADSQAAQLNWRSASFTLSPVNSPTFTANRGYNGDGATSYLTTGLTLSTATLFKQDDAHMGIFVQASSTAAGFDIGTQDANVASFSGTNLTGKLNNAPQVGPKVVPNALGHSVVVRVDGTGISFYRNGDTPSGTAATSHSPDAMDPYICARNSTGVANNFSARTFLAAHLGRSLSTTDVANLYAALNNYKTAVGA